MEPPSSLSNGYWGSFPSVKRPQLENWPFDCICGNEQLYTSTRLQRICPRVGCASFLPEEVTVSSVRPSVRPSDQCCETQTHLGEKGFRYWLMWRHVTDVLEYLNVSKCRYWQSKQRFILKGLRPRIRGNRLPRSLRYFQCSRCHVINNAVRTSNFHF